MEAFPPALMADDLAPGDARARHFDWSGLRLQRIRCADHPLFGAVYKRLDREFGRRAEMERLDVLAERFRWRPEQPVNGHALLYEMLAVLRGEELVAMRDHTAIVPPPSCAIDQSAHVIVHLSHVLVEPPLRGGGLAGWLRALPIQTARECAAAVADASGQSITLVAEMETFDGVTAESLARRRSYERAGFLEIDPERVRYCQPDFRSPTAIDATCVQPVPLGLVVRRVGRDGERSMAGGEVREIVRALYTMFGVHVRADHMAPLWTLLDSLPAPSEPVALRAPTCER
jgi:GNAT superfamily N-acetyltransferase